jgi:hypothetical protein
MQRYFRRLLDADGRASTYLKSYAYFRMYGSRMGEQDWNDCIPSFLQGL